MEEIEAIELIKIDMMGAGLREAFSENLTIQKIISEYIQINFIQDQYLSN